MKTQPPACVCLRRGYQWTPRVKVPRECTFCKTHKWNVAPKPAR